MRNKQWIIWEDKGTLPRDQDSDSIWWIGNLLKYIFNFYKNIYLYIIWLINVSSLQFFHECCLFCCSIMDLRNIISEGINVKPRLLIDKFGRRHPFFQYPRFYPSRFVDVEHHHLIISELTKNGWQRQWKLHIWRKIIETIS